MDWQRLAEYLEAAIAAAHYQLVANADAEGCEAILREALYEAKRQAASVLEKAP